MTDQKTHWKKLVNPEYIGAYIFQPKEEKILTIAKVAREKIIGQGGKKEECTVVHFQENIKPMILNRLNAKIITKIHSTPYIEDWAGKKIQIYVDLVSAFGDNNVEALRIRPFIPNQELPELLNGSKALEKAITHIQQGGKVADIQQRFRLSDEIKLILEGHVKS